MNWWKLLNDITELLADPAKHFWLALVMGSLGYWLILTTSHVFGLVWEAGTRRPMSTGVVSTMHILAILLGLALVLLSHAWLDGFSIWYNTPLGPPLDLKLP